MKKIDKYQKLYDSLKEAHESVRKELEEWKSKWIVLQSERSQWDAEKVKQQQIIQMALTNSNSTNNAYLEEIKALKEENAKLRADLTAQMVEKERRGNLN